jgi:phosphoglycerate dehydrogenase-like enzyme
MTSLNFTDASPAVLMLISSDFVAARHAALCAKAPQLRVVTNIDDCDASEIDALFTFKLPSGIASRLPNLKLAASVGAGADGLLAAGDIPAQVAVTRVVERGLGLSMAQYVAYQILKRFRGFDSYEVQAQERQWQRAPIPDARSHNVGLMGVGEIGSVVAEALTTLGFNVLGWTRSGRSVANVSRIFAGSEELPAFLGLCDTLVCLLPFTADTKGLLHGEMLKQLKPGAYLVNVARGGIVEEADVLSLIQSGHLSGAAFDVFANEPLPASDPLWSHPKVVVTPHIAAQPSVSAAVEQFLENLGRVRNGLTPLHSVDRLNGY